MKKILHKADERGKADHGWLKSYHSFSFASFYDPARVHFGLLRVLNDDSVAPGMGFGEHPHDNMEIVSIPLSGAIEHRDSMGNQEVIRTGDVQIMSAGTGIRHSEYNHSKTEPVKFLQIWVFPKEKGIAPRYEQKTFSEEDRKNRFQVVVSPEAHGEGVRINQNAWFSRAALEKGKELEYTLHDPKNGVYLFLLEGTLLADDVQMERRDAVGIYDMEKILLRAESDADALLIEVPMN